MPRPSSSLIQHTNRQQRKGKGKEEKRLLATDVPCSLQPESRRETVPCGRVGRGCPVKAEAESRTLSERGNAKCEANTWRSDVMVMQGSPVPPLSPLTNSTSRHIGLLVATSVAASRAGFQTGQAGDHLNKPLVLGIYAKCESSRQGIERA